MHARAAHTDASADGVDRVVIGNDRDLGARTRVAGHGLDLDDAVVDLGHFHLEQLGHEFRRCARQEDLRPARFAAHILDIAADAVAVAVSFAADLFVATQNAFATAHIDDDIAVFFALDDTVDDGAGAVAEFFVLAVTLGFADLLQDHLLGRLGSDPAQFDGRDFVDDDIADLGIIQVWLGLRDCQLGLFVLDGVVLDHRAHAGEGGAACLAVDLDANVEIGPVARLGRAGEGFFHRLHDQRGVDHLFARHRIGGLQQFQLVC